MKKKVSSLIISFAMILSCLFMFTACGKKKNSNPYDNEPVEEETTTETIAQADPAAFWLSLSTILLGVALALAIVMLFIKNIRNRRKANKSDAKSHYTVKSRVHKPKSKSQENQSVKDIDDDDYEIENELDEEIDEEVEDTENVIEIDEEVETEQTEQTLDDYVYGEVQDFGENKPDNE